MPSFNQQQGHSKSNSRFQRQFQGHAASLANYSKAFGQHTTQQTRQFTLAVPSPHRIAKLEENLGYVWQNRDLIIQATSRILQLPGDVPFPDDRLVVVDDDAAEILVRHRMVKIGHGLFRVEMEREGFEKNGWNTLLYAFPQQVLDELILEVNKAIMGAILLDGGLEAVAKVMPRFYGRKVEKSMTPVSTSDSQPDQMDFKIKHETNSDVFCVESEMMPFAHEAGNFMWGAYCGTKVQKHSTSHGVKLVSMISHRIFLQRRNHSPVA